MDKVCGLCGHVMTFKTCGYAAVDVAETEVVYLCHADDHDCYHRWTVYGERPIANPEGTEKK